MSELRRKWNENAVSLMYERSSFDQNFKFLKELEEGKWSFNPHLYKRYEELVDIDAKIDFMKTMVENLEDESFVSLAKNLGWDFVDFKNEYAVLMSADREDIEEDFDITEGGDSLFIANVFNFYGDHFATVEAEKLNDDNEMKMMLNVIDKNNEIIASTHSKSELQHIIENIRELVNEAYENQDYRAVFSLKGDDNVYVTEFGDYLDIEEKRIEISEKLGAENFDFRFQEGKYQPYQKLDGTVVSANGILVDEKMLESLKNTKIKDYTPKIGEQCLFYHSSDKAPVIDTVVDIITRSGETFYVGEKIIDGLKNASNRCELYSDVDNYIKDNEDSNTSISIELK